MNRAATDPPDPPPLVKGGGSGGFRGATGPLLTGAAPIRHFINALRGPQVQPSLAFRDPVSGEALRLNMNPG